MVATLRADVEARLGVLAEESRLALGARDEDAFRHAALRRSDFFPHGTPLNAKEVDVGWAESSRPTELADGGPRRLGPPYARAHASDNAATPGSVLPSSNSSDAPPPVEQCVTL